MFVGEVRCATNGTGSSWKLSGGSQLSSAPTKVSKKRQMRRATDLAKRKSSPLIIRSFSEVGRLIQYATTGERAQATTNGQTTICEAGLRNSISIAVMRASNSAGNIDRNDAASP